MKMKKIIVFILLLAIVVINTSDAPIQSYASAANDAIYITDVEDLVVTPGQTTHISIPIRSKSYLYVTGLSLSSSVDGIFTFTRPVLTASDAQVKGVFPETTTYIGFDVTVDDSATIKNYPVNIEFEYSNGISQSTDIFTLTTYLKVKEEKIPAQLTVGNISLASSKIGSDTELYFDVKNEGELTAKSIYLNMDFGTVMEGQYSAKNIKVEDLSAGETSTIKLPVSILGTASVGKNTLTANFTYKNSGGTQLTDAYQFHVNLTTSATAPKLAVTKTAFPDELDSGENFTLKITLKNDGAGIAQNISAQVSPTSITQDGILKNYSTSAVNASDINKKNEGTIEIPLKVSKYATSGIKNVDINITYSDADGVKYSLSDTIYFDVTVKQTVTPTITPTPSGNPNIVISNVSQIPLKPQAGDKVEISFTVENKSKNDATEMKIYADNLSASTFIPLESDPYQYIEKLAAGEKVKVTIPLAVSTGITEGLNNLSIKYTYNEGEGSAIIPIRDVQNEVGSSSMPKLIISKYTTDTEELKAGSTFNLIYDIYNTNSSVAAKNITVTITQADNIFTVTQGSNSFFINKIDPGETSENSIELKVKSDATTKAYPITITIEYEYDGIKPNTETGEVGITKTETLNLNTMENARPVADNINVTSWDGTVMVGTTATLSFEFYNMGKSVLNNVIATVEGDGFTKADGSMYFIGNVEAGSSSYVEFDVTPNYEGTASGVLKISYEDSNGDTVELTKEFTQDVMPATGMDTGINDGGVGEVFNPEMPIAKEAILPVWAFVLIQIGIFIVFVTITRKIIISIYKSKLRKKEQELE